MMLYALHYSLKMFEATFIRTFFNRRKTSHLSISANSSSLSLVLLCPPFSSVKSYHFLHLSLLNAHSRRWPGKAGSVHSSICHNILAATSTRKSVNIFVTCSRRVLKIVSRETTETFCQLVTQTRFVVLPKWTYHAVMHTLVDLVLIILRALVEIWAYPLGKNHWAKITHWKFIFKIILARPSTSGFPKIQSSLKMFACEL